MRQLFTRSVFVSSLLTAGIAVAQSDSPAARDQTLCPRVQPFLAGLTEDTPQLSLFAHPQVEISAELFSDKQAFVDSKPLIVLSETGIFQVVGRAFVEQNTSSGPADSVDCKGKLQTSLLRDVQVTPPLTAVAAERSCADVNRKIYAESLTLLTETERRAFLAKGWTFVAESDSQKFIGALWVNAKLGWSVDVNRKILKVTSPALISASGSGSDGRVQGMHYCKLVPFTRLVNWMTTTALE